MAVVSSKTKVQFSCTSCGESTPRWEGKCPSCGEWNSLVEANVVASPLRRTATAAGTTSLDQVVTTIDRRIATGILEADRVLGEGLVPGALVLLGGDPGIGKSTLALQLADRVGSVESPALYCAGEESPA